MLEEALGVDIVGDPLYDAAGSQDLPHLCAGPDQILCVFHMRTPQHDPYTGVYAMRFRSDGELLDTTPILLSQPHTSFKFPRAVWDGFNYAITWIAPDEGYLLYATRMTADGLVLDGDGAVIASAGYYGWQARTRIQHATESRCSSASPCLVFILPESWM